MHSSGTELFKRDPLADARAARWLEARVPAGTQGRDHWEPITTAPSDGTAILAWVQWHNASGSPCIVTFNNSRWRRVGNGREVAGDVLTHWMRLPTGPRA